MSVNVKKCRECGKIFQYFGKDICPECLQKLDDWFMEIRDYLDEHPSAKVSELSQELEIKEKVIMDFIRQGRIMLKEAVITCNNCGKPINGGDMCDECKSNIGGKLSEAIALKKKLEEERKQDLSVSRTGGMHVKS